MSQRKRVMRFSKILLIVYRSFCDYIWSSGSNFNIIRIRRGYQYMMDCMLEPEDKGDDYIPDEEFKEFEAYLKESEGYFERDIRSLDDRKYRDKFGRWYEDKRRDERERYREAYDD